MSELIDKVAQAKKAMYQASLDLRDFMTEGLSNLRKQIAQTLWPLLREWLKMAADLKVTIRAKPESVETLITTGDETASQPVGVDDLLLEPAGHAADAVRDVYASLDRLAESLNVVICVDPETIDPDEWAEEGGPPAWEERDFLLRTKDGNEDLPEEE